MINVLIVNLKDVSQHESFEFDNGQLPKDFQSLKQALSDRGYSGFPNGSSVTIAENHNTLEVPTAQLPTDFPVITLVVNPVKKLEGGAIDYSEALDMIPVEDDGYHQVIKDLRKIRNWAEDNEETGLEDILSNLRTNTTKDELMKQFLPDVKEYITGKMKVVEDDQSEQTVDSDAITAINTRLDEFEERITYVEVINNVYRDMTEYLKGISTKIEGLKTFYTKKK